MKKICMAFGVFDGIHTGHLHYLKQAKKHGDFLVVAVARDSPEWKFEKPHSLPQEERVLGVKALGIADKVVLGGKKDPLEKVAEIRPDVIALSPYSPISEGLLRAGLFKIGLERTRIAKIRPYKPEIFGKRFKARPFAKQS